MFVKKLIYLRFFVCIMEVLKIENEGLYTPLREYKRDDVAVTAVGMIHIGQESYYKKVQSILDGFDEGFFEGIKEPKDAGVKKEAEKFRDMYKTMAKYMGLTSQKDHLKYQENWENPDMTADEFFGPKRTKTPQLPTNLDWNFVQQKISDLLKDHIEKMLKEQQEQNFTLMDKVQETYPKELSRVLKGYAMFQYKLPIGDFVLDLMPAPFNKEVILTKRNKMLFDAMQPKLDNPTNDKYCVVYGAAHLVELDEYLKRQNLDLASETWLEAWKIDEGMSFWDAAMKLYQEVPKLAK